MRNATSLTRYCFVCNEIKPRHTFPERTYRHPSGALFARFIGPCESCYTSGNYHSIKSERRCNVCRTVKPAKDFYRHAYRTRTGKLSSRFMSKCADCHLAGQNVAPENIKPKDMRSSIAVKRAYNSQNRVRMNRQRMYEQLLTDNPVEFQKVKRTDHMRRKYGISLEQYEALLEKQDRKCLGCEHLHEDTPNGRRRLYVDHNHVTGKVRGLLCHACNASLGLLGEDSSRLRRLADYLETHSCAE